jgi:hypothetical protein
MTLNILVSAIGTLFPVIFPKQEFKPKRLVAVAICLVLVIGSVKLLGVEGTAQTIEIVETLLELTEE